MCPIVTAIDEIIQVYSIYNIYCLHAQSDRLRTPLCLYKWIVKFVFSQRTTEQLVNHSFFVCCFRFNQTFNASTYFKQTVLFPRLNFSMHVNWFYHKKELD